MQLTPRSVTTKHTHTHTWIGQMWYAQMKMEREREIVSGQTDSL